MAPTARRLRLLGAGVLMTTAAATLVAKWTHAKSHLSERHSYLGPAVQQLSDRVPPPPTGAAVVEADRKVFRATRALQGSQRWKRAADDTHQSTRWLLSDFSCASGLSLTPERAPHLASLLANAGADSADVASFAKARFKRARPYVLDRGPTCAATRGLGDFHDYPSGHSSRAYTWALVLAELLPDRRQQLSARAQAYADSRVVCGFHSPTGAGAGKAVAMLTLTSLKRNPRFEADLQLASQELAALKQHGETPSARQCQAEQPMPSRPE